MFARFASILSVLLALVLWSYPAKGSDENGDDSPSEGATPAVQSDEDNPAPAAQADEGDSTEDAESDDEDTGPAIGGSSAEDEDSSETASDEDDDSRAAADADKDHDTEATDSEEADKADPGQADLDKATEAKLGAQSINDLSEVIRLCEKAHKAGLSDTNKAFADKLLAGTLAQRAEVLASPIFDQPVPPARWQQLRQMALSDLEKAVKLDGKQPQLHYLIARLQALPGGDRKRAVAALDDAVRNAEKEPASKAKALILRAELVDDKEKQLADLSEAVKLSPRNPEVFQARGVFYLGEEKYKEAAADLDAALALDATNPKVHEARGIAQFLMQNYDEAVRSFDKVIELMPDSVAAYTQRARVKLVQGNTEAALADLDKALTIDGKSIPVLLLRAGIRQQAGANDKALADVNEVLKLQPGYPKAVEMHAMLVAGKGNFADAIADLKELKKLAPDNVDLLVQLGVFYNAAKQQQQAVDTFSGVLKDDPKNWVAYRGRADAYLGLGKQDAAIADYEAALKLKPGDAGILNNLAWILATSPDDALRNGKRSIELATKACEETKYKQSYILSTLAAAYAETGDYDHAIEWSKKSLELGSEQLKPELSKELASYESHKPWREASPPDAPLAEEPATDEDKVENQATPDKAGAAAQEGDDDNRAVSPDSNSDDTESADDADAGDDTSSADDGAGSTQDAANADSANSDNGNAGSGDNDPADK